LPEWFKSVGFSCPNVRILQKPADLIPALSFSMPPAGHFFRKSGAKIPGNLEIG
jgi:hypothetical protein